MIAKVLPLTSTRHVRGLFDYLVPPELGPLEVGSIVRVRFARRALVAVVAELSPTSELPDDRLSRVELVLPERLPAELVELAVWMGHEYCSTPARALSILLPPGAIKGFGERQVLVAAATAAGPAALDDGTRLTVAQREALAALVQRGETPARELGTELLRRLERRGLVTVRPAIRGRRPKRHAVSAAPSAAPPLTAEQEAALAPVLAALAQAPVGGGQASVGGGQASVGGGQASVGGGQASVGGGQASVGGGQASVGGGQAPIGAGRPRASERLFLLHGVTGSGKTEVYLAAAEAALRGGRSVIILVPEIALTPQALARFEARFGEIVAVLHSGMSDGQRHDEWLRLARGEARVCVGPRSAVFAPLADIGLVVIDEEHESSYKHEGDPRYDARTVGEHRACTHGAVLIAGSATPRPESLVRHERLRLLHRVDGRPLPDVEILDMRGLHHPLHPRTRLALADLKRDGGKAIVLLNRRGWSNFLSCGDCGRVWMCPNCEVALVLHRASASISCHHCGHRERVPARCPDCGSVSVARHGVGTERLEHDLVAALGGPDFPVMRLDADAAGADARARTLEQFAAARAGLLVGTQMVAKGHDFADVRLGVVLDADGTLRFPDFRAEERTFALVTQLAGRAGRGGSGRVLVQTMAPRARPIVLAAAHASDRFLSGELQRREALGYPPFCTLIRVVCAAADPARAAAAAAGLHGQIDLPDARVLGPAPLFTLRGRARVQLIVKAIEREAAIDTVGVAVAQVSVLREHREVSISVDVDPQ